MELYDLNKKAEPFFSFLGVTLVILAAISLIASLGFEWSHPVREKIEIVEVIILVGFLVLYFGRLILTSQKRELIKSRLFESLLVVILLLFGLVYVLGESWVVDLLREKVGIGGLYPFFVTFVKIYLILIILAKFVQFTPTLLRLQSQPGQFLLISFLVLIGIGTVLLMLPKATLDGEGLPLIDAIFTATSAVCVTGLIVVDTATHFTLFGELVILVLIQLGGIGIITFATFFAFYLSSGIGMGQMFMLRDIVQENNLENIIRTLKHIISLTFILELLGLIALYYSWENVIPDSGERIYFAIFHSISAFCNAGFALFTESMAESGTAFNVGVNLTVMVLIIVGGLGFTTQWEILTKSFYSKMKKRRFSLHTNIVLKLSLFLIVLGFLMFILVEWNGVLEKQSFWQKIMAGFFQSITTRTAGFNTVPISELAVPTALFIIILMFIGASPASTAGGLKTTTLGVLLLAARATLRGNEKIEYKNRTIAHGVLMRALTAIVLMLIWIMLSTFVLTLSEPYPFLDLLFEEVSAFSTVGLSRGVTGELSQVGKTVIIMSMFIGRVGSITLAAVFIGRKSIRTRYHYPTENLMVA